MEPRLEPADVCVIGADEHRCAPRHRVRAVSLPKRRTGIGKRFADDAGAGVESGDEVARSPHDPDDRQSTSRARWHIALLLGGSIGSEARAVADLEVKQVRRFLRDDDFIRGVRVRQPSRNHHGAPRERRETVVIEERGDEPITRRSIQFEHPEEHGAAPHCLHTREPADRFLLSDGVDERAAGLAVQLRLRDALRAEADHEVGLARCGQHPVEARRARVRAVDHVASTRPPARPATTAKRNVARTFSRNRDRARVAIAPIADSLPWAILTGHRGKGNRASTTEQGCWYHAAVGRASGSLRAAAGRVRAKERARSCGLVRSCTAIQGCDVVDVNGGEIDRW